MKTPILAGALLALLFAGPGHALGRLGGNAESLLKFGQKAAEASEEITQEEEIQLGRGIASNVLGAAPLVKDEGLQRYVNQVGMWMAMQTERPDLPWRFGVVDSTDVNAFALPGGTVLITWGLYERLRDESELAGVLGHEIAHVVQKHQVKAIKGEMGRDFANEVAGDLAGRSDNELVQRFGAKAFSVGTQVLARGIDRKDEHQADVHGMVIAARAGYDPFSLVGVLQTLDGAAANDRTMGLLFSTHPSPAARIEHLGNVVGEKLDGYTGAPTRPLYRPR